MKLKPLSKKDVVQNFKFLIALLALFIAIYYGLIALIGIKAFEEFTAFSVQKMLEGVGVQGKVFAMQEPVQMLVQNTGIVISELCTGLLEIALLVSAILASFGISLKKRVYGAVFAVFAGTGFNLLRVFASTMQAVSAGKELAVLTHDVLFRMSLLLVIAGMYLLWFKYATGGKEGIFKYKQKVLS